MEWVVWYGRWQRGLLPVEGGVLDQPAKYLDVMEHLDQLTAKDKKDADGRRAQSHPALP